MTPITAPTTTAPPGDPVRAALADPAVQTALLAQAMGRLNQWLSDHPIERRRQEAEEIVVLTQTRALEKSAIFDPVVADVGAWLHGLLVNVIREHCRKLRKQPIQPPTNSSNWDVLDRRFTPLNPDKASELLERLDPEERILVEWVFFDDLSHRQIGERLKIREGAARQRVHRVIAKLKCSIQSERREGDR